MKEPHYTNISPELLQAVLDNPYEGTVIVDENGIVQHFSKANEAIYGVKAVEALGRHIRELIPDSRLHIVVKTGRAEIGESFNARGRHVVVSRYPIKKGGKVIGAVGKAVFHNVRALVALTDKIRELESTVKRYELGMVEQHRAAYAFEDIVGKSPAVERAKGMAEQVALGDSSVLLLGESGTGKELFAHAIHLAGIRKNRPFVRVNCASIPGELFESELFGYDPGAFTGAAKSGKPGKFELADKGSIFLDEIGELPLTMQAKLLRVLQEKEVERLGSRKPRVVDFRVIAATNKDLEKRVREGYFRADLYYRLNVISIKLPPLTEMKADIPLLVEHFLSKLKHGASPPGRAPEVPPEVLSAFLGYDWPGNVRELENVMDRALNLCSGDRIGLDHLPEGLVGGESECLEERAAATGCVPLDRALEHAEREQLLGALKSAGGNISKAAGLLNIHRTTFYYRLRKHGIKAR